jgi:hypothetical protein
LGRFYLVQHLNPAVAGNREANEQERNHSIRRRDWFGRPAPRMGRQENSPARPPQPLPWVTPPQHQSLSGQISGLTIEFACDCATRYVAYMTAAKVIEEIMHLPREEQSRVVEFAFELARKRQLSGKELSAMAQRMVDSDDPAEVERLKAEITRGFYGD